MTKKSKKFYDEDPDHQELDLSIFKDFEEKINSLSREKDGISYSRDEEIEAEIRSRIHFTQIDRRIESGEKNEFKERYAEALDDYQEALFYLIKSEVPDTGDIKSRLEGKIEELKARLG